MKKNILTLLVALVATLTSSAAEFVWGTATWNITDGTEYSDIEDFNREGVVLTFPNPGKYTLTFLNIIAVNYDVYVDDNQEPIAYGSSAQAGTAVKLSYPFIEGHSYKIVTTSSLLAQANLATYTTDTLSRDNESYTISFSIKGPELVKTLDFTEKMSLSIVDQYWTPTYSVIPTQEILEALGAKDISEVTVYGLNPDGSYNQWYMSYYDGWHDSEYQFTPYWGGWDSKAGHNARPGVYAIQLNETCDTISYYFYDSWKEYDPDKAETIPSSGTSQAPNRASVVWDWENEDGTITKYDRTYRVEEGKDYPASFIFVANKRSVIVNAVLSFVTQEEYEEATNITSLPSSSQAYMADGIYSLSGVRQPSLTKGINIVVSDGKAKKVKK